MQKNHTFIIIPILVLYSFVSISLIQVPGVDCPSIGVSAGIDNISITTEKMTLNIADYKPEFIWWHENRTNSDEQYTVRFTKIQEYFGSDSSLDNANELGGISYNLLTSDWDTIITETYNDVTVNLTLSGLANNVVIQFIIKIYTDYQAVNYSGELVKPLKEVQIDIIIDNWQFTSGAQGLALKSEVFDQANDHPVYLYNNTANLHHMDSLIYGSYSDLDFEKAYYNWVDYAGFSNETITSYPYEIGTSFFNETASLLNEEELVHLWFSYSNDINPESIGHTIVLGLYDVGQYTPTAINGYQSILVISLVGFTNVLLIIYRKRTKV